MRFCSLARFRIFTPKMYQDAMQAIHDSLVQKGLNIGLTHIMELIPSKDSDGQVYVFFLFATA